MESPFSFARFPPPENTWMPWAASPHQRGLGLEAGDSDRPL